jgi:hypothetical protein
MRDHKINEKVIFVYSSEKIILSWFTGKKKILYLPAAP